MKKMLVWTLGVIGFVMVAAFILVKIYSQPKPIGDKLAGDALAMKVENQLNKSAWDSVKVIQFMYRGQNKYTFDKPNNKVIVEWDKNKVFLDLESITGTTYSKGRKVEGKKSTKLVKQAWAYWCNDSFWAFAPFKLFDSGTTRSRVIDEKGKENLLIEYASGGVTPGDAYLWQLDENGRPNAFKMWVNIIPLKGLGATWGDWIQLSNGAWLSTSHKLSKFTFYLSDVKEAASLSEMGYGDEFP
jgi:hypothetical protein